MSDSKFLKDLGKKIRNRRLELGLTQEMLANLIGRTQDSISGYEAGTRAMRITELPLLSKALEVPVTFFLDVDQDDYEVLFSFKRLNPHIQNTVKEMLNELYHMQRGIVAMLTRMGVDNEETVYKILDVIIYDKKDLVLTKREERLVHRWNMTSRKYLQESFVDSLADSFSEPNNDQEEVTVVDKEGNE